MLACNYQTPITIVDNAILHFDNCANIKFDEAEIDSLINILYEEEYYYDDYAFIIDSAAAGINFKPSIDYNNTRLQIKNKQQEIKRNYLLINSPSEKKRFRDSVSKIITHQLLNLIIPHWYGTEWDYEGITQIPGEGAIACGYFVSTTLKHIGFNLNRYRFAQLSGFNGAKTLQMGKELRIFYEKNHEDIVETLISKLKPGLYQVGLSYHVGYMLIKKDKAFFIHSNFFTNSVIIEDAYYSDAFISSIYVISDISYNDKLTEKWILNDEIKIIR